RWYGWVGNRTVREREPSPDREPGRAAGPLDHERRLLGREPAPHEWVTLEVSAGVAERAEARVPENLGDVRGGELELRAWRVATPHRVVGDPVDPGPNVLLGDEARGSSHAALTFCPSGPPDREGRGQWEESHPESVSRPATAAAAFSLGAVDPLVQRPAQVGEFGLGQPNLLGFEKGPAPGSPRIDSSAANRRGHFLLEP